MDKTIMYWENKGKEVPTRELIKTPEQIEGIRRAGVVNTGVLDAVAAAIHEGMNTLEIDQICRQYCEEHGAIPACLNYGGDEDTPPFPMSVCTSINEVVCHGVPKEEDVLEEGDIINVDFTTILDGSARRRLRRNSWCVWRRSAWRLAWRLPSPTVSWATLAMR